VSVSAAEPGKERSHQPAERNEWITPEGAEKQIEPYNIRLQPPDRCHEAEHAGWIIERPAAQHSKAIQFLIVARKFVSENCEIQEGIAPQFLSDMESIFAQSSGTGRKGCHQTDLHSPPISRSLEDSMCFQLKLL
jgi:hypothetical protein